MYFALNAAFLFVVLLGAAGGAEASPRVLYLILLFAACSSPLLYADAPNGRHAVLALLLPLLFVYYGSADLLRFVPGLGSGLPASGLSTGILSAAELAVLVGIVATIFGYQAALATWRGKRSRIATKDWRRSTILIIGLSCWLVGILATWIWASQLVERYVAAAQFSAVSQIGLLIARLVQPVGIGLLAYAYISSRSRAFLLLLLAILGVEFVFGFLADSKELSLRSALTVIVGKYLLEGKVPTRWIVVAGFAIALSFAVFQAYRLEVLQLGKQTRAEAASDLSENVDRALQSEIVSGGLIRNGVLGFATRVNLKPTIELVVARVGEDVPYKGGETLLPLFQAVIPRLIWPDKPDVSMGRVFNREFQVSADPNTYISTTHLAEWYWNFGWVGIAGGMFLIGFFLGFIGSRFSLREGRSLTRFMVLVTTIYLLCLRFEGNIAMEYVVWARSLLMVAVLHWLFASVPEKRLARGPAQAQARTLGSRPLATPSST